MQARADPCRASSQFSSIFAYAWLLGILVVFTPDVVTVQEAALTCLLMPVLIWWAFVADKGFVGEALEPCLELLFGDDDGAEEDGAARNDEDLQGREAWQPPGGTEARRRYAVQLEATGEVAHVMFKAWQVAAIVRGSTKTMSPQRAAQVVAWVGGHKSRADYRMQASRLMMGVQAQSAADSRELTRRREKLEKSQAAASVRSVGFAAKSYTCIESDGRVQVYVERHGDVSTPLSVNYETADVTAHGGVNGESGADYKSVSGTLDFEAYTTMLKIEIEIFADYAVEEDESFLVLLSRPIDGARAVSRSHGLSGAAGGGATILDPDARSVTVTIVDDKAPATVSFAKTDTVQGAVFEIVESAGRTALVVERQGNPSGTLSCKFRTFRGTAQPGLAGSTGADYEATYEYPAGGIDGELLFQAGEMSKDITIDVYDSESFRKESVFYVQLVDPVGCSLRNLTVAKVSIVHDYAVEVFANKVVMQLAETAHAKREKVKYKVRHRVRVTEYFEIDSATVHELEVDDIIESVEQRYTTDGRLRVRFSEYGGHAGWCSATASDGDVLLQPIKAKSKTLLETVELDHALEELMLDEKTPLTTCLLSIALFPWRVLCMLTPSPKNRGGWPCFFGTLLLIGAVTVLICDLSQLLGCAVGLGNSTIAITLIAVGTSLPDLYASRSATLGDRHADSAIGNVTGSNAVNVFVGLGLPWLVASIYWEGAGATEEWLDVIGSRFEHLVEVYPDGGFVVPASDLCFSAGVLLLCEFCAFWVIGSRRRRLGYELGGEDRLETALFFGFLWVLFLAMSIVHIHGGFDVVEVVKTSAEAASDWIKPQGGSGQGDSDGSAADGSGSDSESASWSSSFIG